MLFCISSLVRVLVVVGGVMGIISHFVLAKRLSDQRVAKPSVKTMLFIFPIVCVLYVRNAKQGRRSLRVSRIGGPDLYGDP
jgi:hypothetical protein